MKLQDIVLSIVAGAITLAFLGVVFLPAFGKPIDETTRTYVFSLFASAASAAIAWISAKQTERARAEGAYAQMLHAAKDS